MSSEQQTNSKSFTYTYLFIYFFIYFYILYLFIFTTLNDDPPSLYLLLWYLTVLLVLMTFLMDLILSYPDEYLFVYVAIFSGAALQINLLASL